jgi:hypothetical protein
MGNPTKPSPGPPPERFGQYAPAPASFGRTPGPDHWPAADPGSAPFLDPYPDPPGAGPAEPYGLRPETAAWLDSAATDYPDAQDVPGAERLEGPSLPRPGRGYRLPAIAAVVAAVLIGVAAFVLTHHSPDSAGSAADPIAAPNGLGANSGTSHSAAGTRAGANANAKRPAPDNKKTITATGLFPNAQVTVNGLKFTRVVSALNTHCSLAARGAFAAALSSARCQRVVRATFVDSAKQYAVTAGVAALPGNGAASKVDRAKLFGPDIWFTGLDGPASSGASVIGKTVGVGYDVVYGRFIVYALSTYATGHNPTGQQTEIQFLRALSRSFATLAEQPLQSR